MHDVILQEMRQGNGLISNDDLQGCNFNKDENEGIVDAMFREELAAFLGDDFPYNSNNSNSVVCTDSTLFDPLERFDFLTMSRNTNNDDNNMITNNNTDQTTAPHQAQFHTKVPTMGGHQSGGLDSKQQQQEEAAGSNSEKLKRRREPSQLENHVMAERKRRELLTQQFVALSAVVPGLKKVFCLIPALFSI